MQMIYIYAAGNYPTIGILSIVVLKYSGAVSIPFSEDRVESSNHCGGEVNCLITAGYT